MKKIAELQNQMHNTLVEILSEEEQKSVKGGGCLDDKRRERPGTVNLPKSWIYYFYDGC